MKFMKLRTSAYVGGVLRHPHEGVLHIEDEEAQRLLEPEVADDVSDDFTAKQDKETPTESISAPGGMTDTTALPNPHQVEVASQAADAEPAPQPTGRKAVANKE